MKRAYIPGIIPIQNDTNEKLFKETQVRKKVRISFIHLGKFVFSLWLLGITLGTSAQGIDQLKKLFGYDKAQDIDFRVLSTADSADARLLRFIFNSTGGFKITGTLFIPLEKLRQYPAVIVLPDAGESSTDFFGESLNLAKLGIASAVMDALPERPEPYSLQFNSFTNPQKDFLAYHQTVMDIRRTIDCLEQYSGIDHNRLAFIGIGKSAAAGAIASGVESRLSTYILLACPPCISCEPRNSELPEIVQLRNSLTPEQITAYENRLKLLDPERYLGQRIYSSIFFQFAENDAYLPDGWALKSYQAAGNPKTQKYYKIPHQELVTDSLAVTDRINWLKNHL